MGRIRDRFRRSSKGQQERVERISHSRWFRVDREVASLADQDTVRKWLRAFGPGGQQLVFVRRSWGAVVAMAGDGRPVRVRMTDGDRDWAASAPGADGLEFGAG
jgi:hypothetical protein